MFQTLQALEIHIHYPSAMATLDRHYSKCVPPTAMPDSVFQHLTKPGILCLFRPGPLPLSLERARQLHLSPMKSRPGPIFGSVPEQ